MKYVHKMDLLFRSICIGTTVENMQMLQISANNDRMSHRLNESYEPNLNLILI